MIFLSFPNIARAFFHIWLFFRGRETRTLKAKGKHTGEYKGFGTCLANVWTLFRNFETLFASTCLLGHIWKLFGHCLDMFRGQGWHWL